MPTLNIMQTLAAIRKATLSARVRLGDDSIGTHLESGKVQVIRVTQNPGGRRATVVPVSEWLSTSDAVCFLNEMGVTQ